MDRAVAVLFCGLIGFCVGAAATFVIGISQTTSPACDGPCDQWNGVAAVSVVVGCLVAALSGFAWYRVSEPSSVEKALTTSEPQKKFAYRFVPVGEEETQHESSEMVTVTTERLGIGSHIEVELLGFNIWEVIEIRDGPNPLVSGSPNDRHSVPFGGTVICKGVG